MSFTKTTKATKFYSGQRVDVADMQTNLLQYLIDNGRHMQIKALGDGVISGLTVTDNSLAISQILSGSEIATLKGNTANKLCQVFQAKTSNIQNIILSIKRTNTCTGSLTMSICPLTDTTDPTSVIQYTSTVAQASVTESGIGTSLGDITFNFMATAVGAYGALTVGHYYAIMLQSSTTDVGTSGTLSFAYSSANPYAYGFIREVTSSVTTDHATWDLYFKIYSDCVSLSTGFGYKEGQPIIVDTAVSEVELIETTGSDNFLCVRYVGTLTDLEVNPTWGTNEYSRTLDDYEIEVFNTAFTSIDSSWLILYKINHNNGLSLTISDMRPYMPHSNLLYQVYLQDELAPYVATALQRTMANIPYNDDYTTVLTDVTKIKIYREDDEFTSKAIATGTPASSGTVNINPATKELYFHASDVTADTKIYVDYYAVLSAYRNVFTIQDLEVLGNAVFSGNIKLTGNISFDQKAIDSSSDTENDDYVGAETNLKEDLDRIKHEIKQIKGFTALNTWRTASSSSLLQSDFDLAGYTGDGIVKNVKDGALNKLDYDVTTGYSFTIDTGKAIINKKTTGFDSVTTLTVVAPTVGDGLVQVASESKALTGNFGKNTLTNVHKILTISNVLGDIIRYGVDGCTFAVDGSNVVVTKANHHFLEGDYITIVHTQDKDTTAPTLINSGSITKDTFSVPSASLGAGTEANNLDGYVVLDTNGGATTEIGCDLYGSAKIFRVINATTQDANTWAYTYALPRYDIVEMGNDAAITITKGTAAASPTIPTVTDINHQKLYEIYVEELLDNVAGTNYSAYMSGVHNGRLKTITTAFTDRRTWLENTWEKIYAASMDVFSSAQAHYDDRIKRLYRYKSDARISNIDVIDVEHGDLHVEFLYNDDIGSSDTSKISTFMYSHQEEKVYVKNQSYHATAYYITGEQHLTSLAQKTRGVIFVTEDATEYLMAVNAVNTISLAVSGIASNITDVDHDIDFQIWGNGLVQKDSATEVLHKIALHGSGTVFATSLNADYISDGYSGTSLSAENYIRLTNWKTGLIFKNESGTAYRVSVSNAGAFVVNAI